MAVAGSSYWDNWNLRPYNPAELYQQKGNYSYFDDMREDDQIYSILTLKKIMVLGADWSVECEDEEISEFITYCFTEYLDGLFTRKMFEVLSAMEYGFSITEKIFNYCDTEWGKKIVIEKLKTRAPHSFELHTDEYGNLSKLLQHTDKGADLDLDPRKFMIYSYNSEFGNAYGTSEFNKGVYRAWASKNAIIKFWNIYCERYGMPLHIGKMPRAAGEAEKVAFKNIVKNIQAKTGVTLPDDFTLEIQEAGGVGSDVYERAINKYDTMIARKLLVPDLIGISGEKTGGGSYALGKEQFNIFYSTIAYIRNDVERMINKELVTPLVTWNFGNKIEARFKFNAIDEDKKRNDLLLWLDAVKSGKVPINSQQLNWFMEQVRAPLFDEDELKQIEEQKEQLREQLAGNAAGDVPDNKENPEDVNPKEEQDKKKKDEETEKGEKKEYVKFFRELTKYEKRVDFAKIDTDFEEMAGEYLPAIGDAYQLVINALIDDIRRRKIMENKRLDLINKLQLKHQVKTRMLWKNLLWNAYDRAEGAVTKQFTIDQPTGLNDDDIAAWIEQNAEYINGVEGTEILKKVRGVLADGIRSGNGTREMIAQLDGVLSPWEVLQLTTDKNGNRLNAQSRLEGIIRTNINKAYNEARKQEFESLPTGAIVAYQYSAIMDNRTSDVCASLDGTFFSPSELSYYSPPLHINCRSLVVPVFADDEFAWSEVKAPPPTEQIDGGFLKLAKEG